MKQRHREMWAKLTKDSPWEHFVTVENYYRNGTQVEPYNFWDLHRTAFRVDSLMNTTVDVFDEADCD